MTSEFVYVIISTVIVFLLVFIIIVHERLRDFSFVRDIYRN